MNANGCESDGPTLVVDDVAEDVGGPGGAVIEDGSADEVPLSEVVETVFLGTSTDAATPRSTIDTAPGDSAAGDTVPSDPEETADHPSGRDAAYRSTRGPDSQETTAPSVDRTLPSKSAEGAASGSTARDAVPGFTIRRRLGRGGMGIVYEAEQHHLNRMVALKMIHPGRHDNPSDVRRFLIEAEAVAQLDHENIVRIFQVGEAGGGPFFALELLEGGTLADRLGGAPQPVRRSAELAATLARAIQAAHAEGIIHRDLKPSNVLYDAKDVPKITDFGLAKRLEIDDGETRNGQVIGTPSYMSPEQAKGLDQEVGRGADVYSLGVILYEMLTGRPPLKGMNPDETIKLVREKDPVPPSKLRPNIPYDLETICLKCLDKEPGKRYSTADELAEDLERFLDGKPVLARRTPLWERGAKLARRRPLASSLLLVGLVGSAAAAGFAVQAREAAVLRLAREAARVRGLERVVSQGLFDARVHLEGERWDDAREVLAGLLTRTKSEPALAEKARQAEALMKRAHDGDAAEAALVDARARYRRFLSARDAAFFLDARLDGRAEPEIAEAIAGAARAGLGVFAGPSAPVGDAWPPPTIPASLSPHERDEVSAGSYELLLILADAVSQRPGAGPATRADEALAILGRAAALRPSATDAEHLQRAAYLALKGDRAAAERERRQARAPSPEDAFGCFLFGRELIRRRDWAGATAHFDRAIRRRPDHFRARCLLAICHLQTDEPLKAVPLLTACLKDRPDSIPLYLLRGLAYAATGKNARELSRDFARSNPPRSKSLASISRDHLEYAETDYRHAFDLFEKHGDPSRDAQLRYTLLINRGLVRLERQDPTAAAVDFCEAVRLDARRFEAYSDLAEVARRQGRTDEALEKFARAIALKPDWSPLYRGRANVLLGLEDPSPGQIDRALADLDDSIRCEAPGSDLIVVDRSNQASLLRRAGRLEEALKASEAALAIVPKYAPAHLIRVQVLLDLKRFDDLIAACDDALASASPAAESTARLHELRGMARDALGDFAGAIGDYSQALSRRFDEPRLLRRRGWSYLAAEAHQLAMADFDRAVGLDPSDADAHAGRGFARARLGRYREAVNDAELALRRDGANWRTVYNAARVYAQAASAIRREPRKADAAVSSLFIRYRERTLELLQRALDRAPAEQRTTILRETIQADPALRPVRTRLGSLRPSGHE
jgi:tetratricopeptide (TPR) repeat protein